MRSSPISSRRDAAWRRAIAEYGDVLAAFIAKTQRVPAAIWTAPMPGRSWSPAEETLHVIKAYELPLDDGIMRMRVPPAIAWFLRIFLLRWHLWRRTFPHGARAPSEVRPDANEARTLPRDEMMGRLEQTSRAARETLLRADRETPERRMVHAYFGPLEPLTAFRLLTAHTRHHTSLGT